MARAGNRSTASRRLRSDSQYSFAQVPSVGVPRSVFNRSCGLTTAFDAGMLIPIFVDEALPGDTFVLDVSTFARMSTPLVPVMDNIHLDLFFFAVPNRLLWSNWQKFMGEQDNPADSIDFTIPTVDSPSGGWNTDDIGDYLGLPVHVDITTSALWHRAYNLIVKEWFRDENLIDSPAINTGDGPDLASDYAIVKRGKRHDYFTSCLPWPQKGTAVELPLGTSAPLNIIGDGGNITYVGINNPSNTVSMQQEANSPFHLLGSNDTTTGPTTDVKWVDPGLTGTADLSSATAATINAIREAFQIQKLLERDARGGTRYTEIIRSHFGVISPDQRLQRPEYLGGGSAPINIHPIAQSSAFTGADGSPKGDLAAFATSSFQGRGFNKSFTEHCVIMGMACVRADLNYQQGIERMFSRSTRYDFYWPSLAHLGEQEVLSKEIYADGTANDDDIFGYQERYAEYRYKPSRITGRMRSTAGVITPGDATIHYWHLAQEFGARPLLNQAFIEEDPPFGRVLAVANEPEFLFDAYFSYRCVRPMPTYSVPGYIDHF